MMFWLTVLLLPMTVFLVLSNVILGSDELKITVIIAASTVNPPAHIAALTPNDMAIILVCIWYQDIIVYCCLLWYYKYIVMQFYYPIDSQDSIDTCPFTWALQFRPIE